MNIVVGRQLSAKLDLTLTLKAVYEYLIDLSDENNICFPSHKTIAQNTKMCVSSVQKAIRALMNKGYIIKKQRKRENGGQTSNFYIIVENPFNLLQIAKAKRMNKEEDKKIEKNRKEAEENKMKEEKNIQILDEIAKEAKEKNEILLEKMEEILFKERLLIEKIEEKQIEIKKPGADKNKIVKEAYKLRDEYNAAHMEYMALQEEFDKNLGIKNNKFVIPKNKKKDIRAVCVGKYEKRAIKSRKFIEKAMLNMILWMELIREKKFK